MAYIPLDRDPFPVISTLNSYAMVIKQSDLRVGQLLSAVAGAEGKDLFYMENDELARGIKRYLDEM